MTTDTAAPEAVTPPRFTEDQWVRRVEFPDVGGHGPAGIPCHAVLRPILFNGQPLDVRIPRGREAAVVSTGLSTDVTLVTLVVHRDDVVIPGYHDDGTRRDGQIGPLRCVTPPLDDEEHRWETEPPRGPTEAVVAYTYPVVTQPGDPHPFAGRDGTVTAREDTPHGGVRLTIAVHAEEPTDEWVRVWFMVEQAAFTIGEPMLPGGGK